MSETIPNEPRNASSFGIAHLFSVPFIVDCQFIFAKSPEEIHYTKYGISDAIVVDNTGIWRDAKKLGVHMACPGVSKVILTAPSKGGLPTVVAGVNDNVITPEENIYSAASCTTNAIVPVLKLINDRFGIQSGHVETVHSFTNDQNLIDNYHPKARRGRSAALNMVLTETGAATAVAEALPEMAGKLTGNAIRVPTPNVSMAILILELSVRMPLQNPGATTASCRRAACLRPPRMHTI